MKLPRQVSVYLKRSRLQRWQKVAKEYFPMECYAYLIGYQTDGDRKYHIEDLVVPEDLENYVTETSVRCDLFPDSMVKRIEKEAKEQGLEILGDIHSHPYEFAIGRDKKKRDAAPSEGDLIHGWTGITGVCAIIQQKDGRLFCRTRFYGPTIKASVIQQG